MRKTSPLAPACLALLLALALLVGCGYEHNPVRVRWEQTLPETETLPTPHAYALHISPPWPDGGYLTLSLPNRITADGGKTTLFSFDDQAYIVACSKCPRPTLFTAPAGSKVVRCSECGVDLPVLPSYRTRNPWDIAPDERTATLEMESPSTPGVHLTITLKVDGPRLDFDLALRNETDKQLSDLDADFSCDFVKLAGFNSTSVPSDRSFSLVKGAIVPMTSVGAERSVSVLDKRNLSELPTSLNPICVDRALLVLADARGKRRFLFNWEPGQSVSVYPDHLAVNPHLANILRGQSVHAHGLLLFSGREVPDLLKDAIDPAKYPPQ